MTDAPAPPPPSPTPPPVQVPDKEFADGDNVFRLFTKPVVLKC